MISIIPHYNNNYRAFGWIQDSSNFRSLCNVVSIFDENSDVHKNVKENLIPKLVSIQDGQDILVLALNKRPLKILYMDLVGKAFIPRNEARCNGIVQATIKGQKREFISDWPADNYVRWAHAFGFIKYNYSDDTFEITNEGLSLSNAEKGTLKKLSTQEESIITNSILAYPPAIRILKLLSENENIHLTKFEIGKMLGFVGESGFTSLPQSLLIKSLATTKDNEEKNKMKIDWDGSSDKYARMICKWLEKLKLVEQSSKKITVTIAGNNYSESISQAYIITAKGLTYLNRSLGKSKHKRISKNIFFEMLATKVSNREYIRTRRALVLKYLSEKSGFISIDEIKKYLLDMKIEENNTTIVDDINGLINIGINILCKNDRYKFEDFINDFIIPLPQKLAKSDLNELKESLRQKLKNISHDYLSLVDLAYDSSQNRMFEMKTLELLIEECNFEGLHLGGTRRPDGIVFTTNLEENFGIIIDTKAYSKGFSLPINQADEMERYIRENQTRDQLINPNKWWTKFDPTIKDFYYMFVSGFFKGNFESQLDRIFRNTNVYGTAVSIGNLLILADNIKSAKITKENIKNKMFCNNEFI